MPASRRGVYEVLADLVEEFDEAENYEAGDEEERQQRRKRMRTTSSIS